MTPRKMRVVFFIDETHAGTVLADLTMRGVEQMSFSVVTDVPFSKNKKRGQLALPAPEILPPEGKRIHRPKHLVQAKRQAIADAVIKHLEGQQAGMKLQASEVVAGAGFAYDLDFRAALDDLVRLGKIRRQNVGGNGVGKIKYVYSLPAQKKMSDEERKAKDRERKQRKSVKQKPPAKSVDTKADDDKAKGAE
jgi:hypothetical protein